MYLERLGCGKSQANSHISRDRCPKSPPQICQNTRLHWIQLQSDPVDVSKSLKCPPYTSQGWDKQHKTVDHDDPSKPSHRLTNGPEPSKTIESDGRKIKNHRKTIDGNGQTAKKHSMVMVSSKTIENLQWSLQNH